MTRVLTHALCLVTLLGSTRADDASLLDLVGTDVGVCVHVVDGAATVDAAWKGELAKRLRETATFEQWLNGPDYENFTKALGDVERAIGRPVGPFATDLLGREVVLALYPVANGEPEAVLVTRTAGPEALANAIATWHRLDPDHETSDVPFEGIGYHRRVQRGQSMFHAALGSTFVISEHEERVREVVARHADETTGGLAASRVYLRARRQITGDVAATAYFSPEAWLRALPPADDEGGRIVEGVAKTVESAILALRTGDGVILEGVVLYDGTAADDRWQQYVEWIDGQGGGFLERVPDRALYTGVGRVDVGTIARVIWDSIPENERRTAEPWRRFVAGSFLRGLDPLDDVLPAIGPEWGAYVVPRAELTAGVSPVEGLLAVELPRDDGDEAEKIRGALGDLLTSGAEFWITIHNSSTGGEEARIETRETNGVTFKWVEGIGPYRPAFGVTAGHLVISSSPDLISEFTTDGDDAEWLVDRDDFRRIRAAHFASANQLAYLNVAEVRRFVGENREFLLGEIARSRGGDPSKASRRVVRLEEFLGLTDALFGAASVESDRVRIVVGAIAEPSEETP